MVQICLGNEQGLKDFTDRMRSVARSEQMTFVDGSSDTKKDLETMGALRQAGPIIHMGVEREDGLGLTAGNIGLPGFQVAVGFSEGSNPPEAHAFAKRVIDLLETQWRVETVPPGKGALPLKSCNTPT